MILYIKDPRDVTRKFLKIRNIFCKLAGYKINTQIKRLPIQKHAKREIKVTHTRTHTCIHTRSQNVKYESKKHKIKTLKGESTRKWKICHAHQLVR